MINKQIYSNMKKFLFIIFLGLLLVAVYSHKIYAQSDLPGSSAAKTNLKTSVEANLIDNLKQRAQTEITRRLNFLKDLQTKITSIKKITDSDKSSLQNQIQTQIDELNSLQAKINSDTDLTTLRTDVKSIINGYYIFAFFRVKISLLVAADRLMAVSDLLEALETKLKTRVDQASAAGMDVSNLETLLSDMTTKINNANTQIQKIQTDLASLTAQGFPGNKSVLLLERSKLKTAYANLKAAHQDAIQIRQGLVKLEQKINNTSGLDSTNLTPTSTNSPTPAL
jgi:hypothetical protein